ncbi:MAG TPA: MFS transporter [Geobacterales bacterium]|nr:MFS transporter [Geobacterales bacterium]
MPAPIFNLPPWFSMLSLAHFRLQRRALRSLIYLFWIYSFVSRAVGIFSQIYIYELFNSVQLNIIAAIVTFTGIMIGFCICGVIAARYSLNAKHGFLLSFLFTGLGLILLPLAHDVPQACGAVAIRGIGSGLFWLTIHTYELMKTSDHERDIYSTFLSAGDQIVTLASPAFATLLIWISHRLGVGDFTLLFVALPPLLLLGLPALARLNDYRPAPIGRHDLVYFFADRRNQAAQIYLMGGAATHILQQAVIPLAAFIVLGSALNVGGFNTVFSIAGAVALLAVGSRRRPENRLFILGMSSIVLVALDVMLGFSMTLVTLIAYTIGTSITQPIMRVSQHVIDLKTMDGMSHRTSDFYPAMILRDVALWVWRTLAALILLAFATDARTGQEVISLGLYFIAGATIITYAGARILLTWRR